MTHSTRKDIRKTHTSTFLQLMERLREGRQGKYQLSDSIQDGETRDDYSTSTLEIYDLGSAQFNMDKIKQSIKNE